MVSHVILGDILQLPFIYFCAKPADASLTPKRVAQGKQNIVLQ